MKTFSILSLTLGIALVSASCNNSPDGRATPIDSTNDNGPAKNNRHRPRQSAV